MVSFPYDPETRPHPPSSCRAFRSIFQLKYAELPNCSRDAVSAIVKLRSTTQGTEVVQNTDMSCLIRYDSLRNVTATRDIDRDTESVYEEGREEES